MAINFPSNPQINDTYDGYIYIGNGIWELIGVDLTADYPEITDGKISASVIPNIFTTESYVDSLILTELDPYLVESDASATYLTKVTASTEYATISYVDTEIGNIDALPSQATNSGKFLTTDGSAASWADIDALPSQDTHDGKFLTTNGVVASWENVDALPTQSGNTGRFLTTDGSAASWAELNVNKTLQEVLLTGNSASTQMTITDTTQSTSSSTGALVVSGGVGVGKDLWVEGDLHVNGTTTTTNTQTVSTSDNLIYLNAAQDSTITNAVYSSGSITYTAENSYSTGMDIRITGVTPSGFNISSADQLTVASATPTQFIVVKSDPGESYSSGGTAHAKLEVNADLGFAGGYYSNGYAHAGLFRDASDGAFKFFSGYTPEPDEAVNIDTTHASFELAPINAASATFSGNIVYHVDILTPSFIQNEYTLSSIDDGKLIVSDNGSAATIYVPTDSAHNFSIGTQINIIQGGAGQITISATSPTATTINYTPGNKLRTQWSSATLVKISANNWVLMGDLSV